MPPNPMHFSAVAPLHFMLPESFDITALLLSSTFVDLELLYYFFTEGHMGHGFWHSYFFVLTIYPVVLSLIVYIGERKLKKTVSGVYGFFRFFPTKIRYSFMTVYFSCLVGGLSHIFFDMWTHENSPYVLFPLNARNPFWIGEWSILISVFVGLLSICTVFLWIRQMRGRRVNSGEKGDGE